MWITSAPKSPRIVPAAGPKTNVASSTTLSPSRRCRSLMGAILRRRVLPCRTVRAEWQRRSSEMRGRFGELRSVTHGTQAAEAGVALLEPVLHVVEPRVQRGQAAGDAAETEQPTAGLRERHAHVPAPALA